MPITQTIDPLARLILGVGSGDITLEDLATFTRDVVQAGLIHYSKLIDIAHCTATFTPEELAAFVTVLREIPAATPRGPLAFVAHRDRDRLARAFAGLDIDGRPARVFDSIHDARKWLREQAAPVTARKPGRRP
ncbi:MAG: hypothetical protein NTV97_01875 [Alphaproteobacteria bacterium]|nr:hypothetical protein [Alphaproteobacteria bacterium]